MTLATLREYGWMHGASKQAVTGWKAKGAIVLTEGKVNVELSDQRMRHAGLGRFKTAPAPSSATRQASSGSRQPSSGEGVVDGSATAAPVDLNDPETQRTLQAFVSQLLRGEYADAATAATVKENALALKHVIAAQRAAGDTVSLEEAERVMFEAARQMRDAWLNWPSRVGPLIASTLCIDTDKLVHELSTHVHQHLADLGEPEGDFAAQPASAMSRGHPLASTDA